MKSHGHQQARQSPVKAIILSAGQGRRLLPLTSQSPKCLLPIQGKTLIEWQIDELARCGIDEITVVVGYGADQVEQRLIERYGPQPIRTLYNPFFTVSDNLASCWMARTEMTEDFLLLNGDTLFESAVVRHLLESSTQAVTLARDHKPAYDADDMKVSLNDDRLIRIGKNLAPSEVDGESIGILLFRGPGPLWFRETIEQALRQPQALKQWYLSVIDDMARSGHVGTLSIQGLRWAEVDCPADLERAEKLVTWWGDVQTQQLASAG